MTRRAAKAAILLIDEIAVGPRHRRELGDIEGLAASMGDLDMLEPIVVRPDDRGQYQLVCGARRLAAAKQLGQTKVSVIVRNLTEAEALKAEFAENVFRKDFTLSEAVAIKRELEPIERAAAKERQGVRTDKHPGKLPASSTGRAADKAAKATGMARRTLEKAEAIVDAAEAEPEKYGPLAKQMDRTGRVNGVFKRLKVLKQAERIRAEPPPLPGNGPYRVFTIDPPWKNEVRADDPSHRTNSPFPPMSVDEIRKLEIRSIAKPDSIVWLWVTDHQLLNGIHNVVLDAWGLKPRALLTWVKTNNFGTGDWLRGQTEHCVMATWGTPVVTLSNESTVLFASARGHSLKPPEFYDLVEKLCPAPRYADLFSRYRHNDKWDCHGDEAPSLAELEAAE